MHKGFFVPVLEYGILDTDIYCMEKLTRQQIEEKLNELAYLEIPKLNKSELKVIRRTRVRDPDDIDPDEADDELVEEVYPDVVQDDANITYPAEIQAIKYQRVQCPDCGQPCRNRKTDIKYYPNSNRPHWREHCLTCDTSRNPWTGEMNIPTEIAREVYAAYERESADNPRENSKYIHFKTKQVKDK
jgi:hypothetical protein